MVIIPNHLVRVLLQPGVVRVVAQGREPPAQGEEGRNGLGANPVHPPQAITPLLVGQQVVPDMAAGPREGRQQEAGRGLAGASVVGWRVSGTERLLPVRWRVRMSAGLSCLQDTIIAQVYRVVPVAPTA